MRRLLLLLSLILLTLPAYAMLKQRFGGNIKVAEELIKPGSGLPLFEIHESQIVPLLPLQFEKQESTMTIDLSSLDNERMVAIQNWTESLKDFSNPCHWVLDYPYYDHQHPTTIRAVAGKLTVSSAEEDYVDVIASSACLLPPNMSFLNAFNRTQFGYEANEHCISGRPFLDSISPVVVDASNPYLSLKLNDVDVASVPEDRFNQISADADLNLIEGPQFYVYLTTARMTVAQVSQLIASIDLQEITRAVLNDHAEIELASKPAKSAVKVPPVYFSYPADNPYRLLAERLRIEWEGAGISFLPANTGNAAAVRLSVLPVNENSMDSFRYHLLQAEFSVSSNVTWFDLWDQMEASGRLVPLLIHKSRLAVRKKIQDLQVASDGRPDFAGCWLLP